MRGSTRAIECARVGTVRPHLRWQGEAGSGQAWLVWLSVARLGEARPARQAWQSLARPGREWNGAVG